MMQNVTLSPKQQTAIRSLLTGSNQQEAAQEAGVSRRTLQRWLDDPAFRGALQEAESEALEALSRRLVSLSDKAAGTLEEVMDSDNAGHRLRASDIVLSNLLRIKELVDLEARILALESALQEGKG